MPSRSETIGRDDRKYSTRNISPRIAKPTRPSAAAPPRLPGRIAIPNRGSRLRTALVERTVTTAHVNGPDAPWHLRLLVRLTALGAGDFQFFTGKEWDLLSGLPHQ